MMNLDRDTALDWLHKNDKRSTRVAGALWVIALPLASYRWPRMIFGLALVAGGVAIAWRYWHTIDERLDDQYLERERVNEQRSVAVAEREQIEWLYTLLVNSRVARPDAVQVARLADGTLDWKRVDDIERRGSERRAEWRHREEEVIAVQCVPPGMTVSELKAHQQTMHDALANDCRGVVVHPDDFARGGRAIIYIRWSLAEWTAGTSPDHVVWSESLFRWLTEAEAEAVAERWAQTVAVASTVAPVRAAATVVSPAHSRRGTVTVRRAVDRSPVKSPVESPVESRPPSPQPSRDGHMTVTAVANPLLYVVAPPAGEESGAHDDDVDLDAATPDETGPSTRPADCPPDTLTGALAASLWTLLSTDEWHGPAWLAGRSGMAHGSTKNKLAQWVAGGWVVRHDGRYRKSPRMTGDVVATITKHERSA